MAASYNSLDNVLTHFKDMDCPFFIISEDKKHIFFANSTINDIDEAADKLREKLEDRDHTKPYHIYCFKNVTKGGLVINSKSSGVYFSYQKQRPEYNNEYRSDNRGLYELVRTQGEELRELRAMLLRNQEEALAGFEDEEDEETVAKSMQSNVIGALLGNPAIQNILINLLTNIAGNIVTPAIQQTQQQYTMKKPTAMAGTGSEEELNMELAKTLEIIFSKGVTLDHLKKIAAMPELKIKGILMML